MNTISKQNNQELVTVSPSFSFDGSPVRIDTIDEKLWFVARDVAMILGYSDAPRAIRDHCRKQSSVGKVGVLPTLSVFKGLHPQTTLINEGDVNRLILRSKLPAAERFQDWLFEEVLPSIRKTGSYGVQIDPIKALNDPAFLRTTLLTYTEKVLVLEARVSEMAPSVAALERIGASDCSLCITDSAKTLKIKPKELFSWLSANEWIYSRAGKTPMIGYQARIQAGLLEHVAHMIVLEDGTQKTVTQVRVTAKGLAKLAKAFPASEAAA
jgi:anti-repressor protein